MFFVVLPAMHVTVQEFIFTFLFPPDKYGNQIPYLRPRRAEVDTLLLGIRMTKLVNAQHVGNVQMCRKKSMLIRPDLAGGQGAFKFVGWLCCLLHLLSHCLT